MADEGESVRVERVTGPTPAGGAYSEAYYAEDGTIAEIVEYDADGHALQRTYGASLIDDARAEVEAMEAAMRARFGPEHRLLRPDVLRSALWLQACAWELQPEEGKR